MLPHDDPKLQQHTARIKHQRRVQRQRLAAGLCAMALLATILTSTQAATEWLLVLPLLAAIFFAVAAWLLRLPNATWEMSTTVAAVFLPPLLAALWAYFFQQQLPASSLILPFVLQPMLLLLASLPLSRYVAACVFNFLLITSILISGFHSLIAILSVLSILLFATVLGLNAAYRFQHSQQSMFQIRQRVAENAEKMAVRDQKMRKLAFEDPLTGLSNRLYLINQLRQILKSPRAEAMNSVVFLIDLDFFKTVNDEHGHAAGDALLIEIAHRFRSVVRRGDLVCRLGGDEFVILVRGLTNPTEISSVADKILGKLAEPVWYQQQLLPLGGSIGIAPWQPDVRSPAFWLQEADHAMYQAKSGGRNRYVMTHEPSYSGKKIDQSLATD